MERQGIGAELIESLPAAGGSEVEVRQRGGRLTLRARDADHLGVLVESIEIDRIPGWLAAAALHRRLARLAERLDYLPERIVLVEHDPSRTGALMRSASPRRSGGDRVYFELRVERSRDAALRRFRQPPGGAHREAIAFLLDRETLARLADDLMTALNA
jgi:hypothetical protein